MADTRQSPPFGPKPRVVTPEQRLRRGIHESGLPDGEVRLFTILLDKAEFKSAIMRVRFAPTVAELMRLCDKSRATIYRRLDHLERHRWAVLPPNAGRRSAKVVRVLQLGERCECPRHGGDRRKPTVSEPTTTPEPTPETVSSWQQGESHLGTETSLILKPVSAGQSANPRYGASMGEELGEGIMHDPPLGRSLESWRSWPAGTNGYEANPPR